MKSVHHVVVAVAAAVAVMVVVAAVTVVVVVTTIVVIVPHATKVISPSFREWNSNPPALQEGFLFPTLLSFFTSSTTPVDGTD